MFSTELPRHWPWIAAFGLAYIFLTLTVDNSYYLLIMTNVLVWAVVGLSWNIFSGYSGLISFGHAAFFGTGAYFVVLAQINWNLSPWVGIPLAGGLGALAGIIVGIPTFRLRGHYFALAMLAYPLALLYVFEWLGYQEVAVPMVREAPLAYMQFDNGRAYVLIALALLILAMGLTTIVERSRYGMSLMAIKQDETAAEASGIDTLKWKLRAIALSGGMAAAIGGFYAVVQLIVTPLSVFGILVSAQALVVVMFGGVGTTWGPILGATTLVPLSAWLDARYATELPGIQGVVYGAAIIGVILLAPEGVFWKIRDLLARSRLFPRPIRTSGENEPDRSGSRFRVARGLERERLLEVKHLSKTFGGLKAVSDVSLDVFRGEILGIIGPNGAGKTTLFNLMNGFIRADTGEVLFRGTRVDGRRPNRICAGGIGRTFQVVKPFPRMSLGNNVIIGAYVHATTIEEARCAASDALAVVGLSQSAEQPAGSASNRDLRLMEIARALATKPELLLLDEVFAGLTSAETNELVVLLRKLAGLGITIAIIEHTMGAMVQLVDRFVVLDHGSVLTSGKPDAVTKDPAVIEAYLGKKWVQDA